MILVRRKFLRLAGAATVAPALTHTAVAQSYPARPVTMVVPFGAGGPADTIGRILAEGMRGPLGQPVIVENVAGASGTIAVGRVARAVPDGYTAVLGNWATHVLNGPMFALPYDLQRDFQPVSLVCSDPLIIVAKKGIPANDLKELVAWLRANPEATQGTTGAGGVGTVAGLLFQRETGTRFRFVPYRGGQGPAMQAVVAGQIDFMIATAANSLAHVAAGTIKAYAVTSKSRMAAAPNIPTVAEAGLSGLHALNWQAIFVPKATPKNIAARLNAAVVTTLADLPVRRRLSELGQDVFPRDQQTPEALRAFQDAEIERWWPIIRAGNIKGE
ncbi:MAG: tripartite tricarboxylate transporter substrate binding protein BugD [Xanthobacteraceae bacterium]|nr:tripartite tricarboxylate transporter substrate binding protein BugD [Xanthobacteraceae bacterium]